MSGLGQAAFFPPTGFQHYAVPITFVIKLETMNGQRWDTSIAGLVPASVSLLQAFRLIISRRSYQTWNAFAEYLMLQHVLANCPESDIELLGWQQGFFLRIGWNTKLYTTACRFFHVSIRQELNHEMTSGSASSFSSSDSEDEL